MVYYLVIAFAVLWTALAHGQTVPGRFPAGTIFGNPTASEAQPQTALPGAFGIAASEVLNVTAYGAVCDGTTDDTTAIRNAVAAWKATAAPPTPKYGAKIILQGPGRGNRCKVTGPIDFTNTSATSSWGALVRDLFLYAVYNYTGPVGTATVTTGGTGYNGGATGDFAVTLTNGTVTGGATGCTSGTAHTTAGVIDRITVSAPGCGTGYDVGNTLNVTGGAAQITVATLSGGAVIDATGSRFVQWDDVSVEGDCTTIPNVLIAFARYSIVADYHWMRGLKLMGCWKFAALYNFGSEVFTVNGGKIYSDRATGAFYGMVLDGANHFNWSSPYKVETLAVDVGQSFNGLSFLSLNILTANSPDATPIWIGRAAGHKFIASYAAAAAGSQCGAILYSSSQNTRSSQLEFDLHFEITPASVFCIQGPETTQVFNDFVFKEYHMGATSTVFGVAPNITSVTAYGLDVRIGFFQTAGATLFGNPSIWTVVPTRIEVPAAGNYVAPGVERTGGWICILSAACRPSGGGGVATSYLGGDGNWTIPTGGLTGITVPSNTFYGVGSGIPTLTGIANTAVGTNTSNALTTGNNNTAIGTNTLTNLTSGTSNTALGVNTLISNVISNQNTAVGAGALADTIGNGTVGANTALGYVAGVHVSTGFNNLILGNGVASTVLTTGFGNILIGVGPACDTTTSGTNNQFKVCSQNSAPDLMVGDLTPGALQLTLGGDLTVSGGDVTLGTVNSVLGTASFASNTGTGTVRLQPIASTPLGSSILTLPARTATVATTTGTLTSGRCTELDASGNIVQSAAACGTVTAGIAQNTVLGSITAGTNAPVALTTAQQTSMCDPFSTSTTTKGCVAGSNGAAATSFLNATGGWTVPAGTTGGTIASAAAGQVALYTGTTALGGSANLTWTSPALTIGASGVTGRLTLAGSTSGTTTLQSAATASGNLTLPAATDTLVGKATTDAFTNKTFNTGATGNAFQIAGTGITAISGNTAKLMSAGAGTFPSNNCAEFDANSNIVDAGAPCVVLPTVAPIGLQAATVATSGTSGSYLPGDRLTVSGGTFTTAAVIIIARIQVRATPTIVSGGTTCSGTVTMTGTTGGGTFFTATGTVSGGAVTSITGYTPGNYYTSPTNLANEPTTTAGGCTGTQPVLSIVMGPLSGYPGVVGNYSVAPTSPVTITGGSGTGATWNVVWSFVPALALDNNASNITSFNTFYGTGAGAVTTSPLSNTYIGYVAGGSTTTGGSNTVLGASALFSLTTGGNNTAIGVNTIRNVTTGNSNVAVGSGTLTSSAASTATSNTAVGTNALLITTGNGNTALGSFTGNKLTGGLNNLLLGTSVASTTLVSGNQNILLGTAANCDTTATGTNYQFKVCARGGATDLMVGDMDGATLNLAVNGPIATPGPVTKTGTSGTAGALEPSVIINASGTFTLTLPSASAAPGRWLHLKSISAQIVNSATGNVVPLATATAGTAIFTATAGQWATLQSDGTNWVKMAGN